MAVNKKKIINSDEIETLDEKKDIKETKKQKKEQKDTKWTIFLVISILLLLSSIGLFTYLYNANQKTEQEFETNKQNVKKVEEAIQVDQKAITEKENEYEKLKEKVKESLEELNTWEELKEELNKSLS